LSFLRFNGRQIKVSIFFVHSQQGLNNHINFSLSGYKKLRFRQKTPCQLLICLFRISDSQTEFESKIKGLRILRFADLIIFLTKYCGFPIYRWAYFPTLKLEGLNFDGNSCPDKPLINKQILELPG